MKMYIGFLVIMIGFLVYHNGLVDSLDKKTEAKSGTNVIAIGDENNLKIVDLPGYTYSYKKDPNTRYPLQIIIVGNHCRK